MSIESLPNQKRIQTFFSTFCLPLRTEFKNLAFICFAKSDARKYFLPLEEKFGEVK